MSDTRALPESISAKLGALSIGFSDISTRFAELETALARESADKLTQDLANSTAKVLKGGFKTKEECTNASQELKGNLAKLKAVIANFDTIKAQKDALAKELSLNKFLIETETFKNSHQAPAESKPVSPQFSRLAAPIVNSAADNDITEEVRNQIKKTLVDLIKTNVMLTVEIDKVDSILRDPRKMLEACVGMLRSKQAPESKHVAR